MNTKKNRTVSLFKERRKLRELMLMFSIIVFILPNRAFGEQTFKKGLKTKNEGLAVFRPKAKTFLKLGYAYEDLFQYDKSIFFKQTSAELFSYLSDHELQAKAYKSIGRDYYYLDDYQQAMLYYLKALDIYERYSIRNKSLGHLYHYIGSVFKRVGNYPKAYSYYREEYNLGTEINEPSLRAESLYLISQVIEDTSNVSSIDLIHKSVAIYDSLGRESKQRVLYLNLAEVYLKMEDYDSAFFYQSMALDLSEKSNSYEKVFTDLVYMSEIYLLKNDYEKGNDCLQKADNLIDSVYTKRDLHLSSYHKNYSKLYECQGNYEKAYHHLVQYVNHKFQVLRMENIESVSILEAEHNLNRKQHKIEILKNENQHQAELNQIRQDQKNVVIMGIIVILFIVSLSTFFFLMRWREGKRKNRIISGQQKRLENQMLLLEKKNKDVLDSIRYAKRIQDAILPPKKLVKQYLESSFIFYRPKDIVAGDFFWMEIEEEKIYFAAADCTGHGVPGAIMSVLCSNILTRTVKNLKIHKLNKILESANSQVREHFSKSENGIEDGMDLALCSLDFKHHKLEYVGANSPLYVIRKGEFFELKPDRKSIGSRGERTEFHCHTFPLIEGDCIYIFTDGYADQFGGPKGKKFMYHRFRKLLLEVHTKPMEEQGKIIESQFVNWKGSLEQVDDICVIGLKV